LKSSPFVVRNIASTLVTQVLTWILTFCVTLKLPQYLGAGGLGKYTLSMSIAGFIAPVAALGLSPVLIRRVARNHSCLGELAQAASLVRAPISLLAVGVGAIIAWGLGSSHDIVLYVTIALISVSIGQMSDICGSSLAGLEQIHKQNFAQFIDKTVFSVGILALIFLKSPIWTIYAIAIVSATVGLAANFVLIRPYLGALRLPKRSTVVDLVREGWAFVGVSVFTAFYGLIDPPLLTKISGSVVVGWYGLGSRFVGASLFFSVALCSALFPTLARIRLDDPAEFAALIKRMFRLVTLVSVPIGSILIFAPISVIKALKYSKDFYPAAPVLCIFGVGVIVWSMTQIAGTMLTSLDRQQVLTKCAGWAALLFAPFCALCIYIAHRFFGNGALGAAMSDVALESILFGCYLRFAPRGIVDKENLLVLVKVFLACLPVILALRFTEYTVNSMVMIGWTLAGAAVYFPLCLLLRVLPSEDIRIIKTLFLNKLKDR
jgi:O-antigen/teichoic acid export membrane protein